MESFIPKKYKGEIYAFASGVMYGLIGYFGISIINASNSAENMIFWRFLFSAIILLIFTLVKRSNKIPNYKEFIKVFLYGALFYYPSTLVYFRSCVYIGSGLAMVIFFTYPVIVVLINRVFYKESISKLYYLALIIIAIGMILIADFGNSNFSWFGIIYAIFSAIFYGLYIVFTKNVANSEPVFSSFVVSLGCTFAAFLFTLFDGSFALPGNIEVVLNITGMALISTAIPILLLLESMKYISSTKASILSVSEPIFVVIFGMILLGEQVSIIQAIGVFIILSGAIVSLLPGVKKSSGDD
ncbi:MAG: hypothetical protein RLZZ59_368 [Pseudomonadota bacterium]|jgi:drug/metabolite transporter (DMT)-like permease